MEQLTRHYVYPDGKHGYEAIGHGMVEQRPFFEIIKRLAEYEDTGLTPEEVQNLAAKWQGKELNKHITELLDAEEQGLLIKLPCKVGDTVYDIDFGRIMQFTITGFSYGLNEEDEDCEDDEESESDNEIRLYCSNWNGSITQDFAISAIDKSVFLTREAAEKALKLLDDMKNRIINGEENSVEPVGLFSKEGVKTDE